MIRVGVLGAHGRMGKAICETVDAAQNLELVARVDASDELAELARANSEVVVDVTNIDAARHNLPWLALHGMHAVVGTTGFTEDDVRELGHVYETEQRSCLIVPNFSIGAVLMMRFAEQAAHYFDGVEIIELHHEQKKDAPSGTARMTADRISAARSEPWAPDPTEHETVPGVRGGDVDGVHLHSVRLPGLLAHQEVIFGSAGQTLTLRHDSFDRSAFMPGVLRAIGVVGTLAPGITVGLDAAL